MLSAGDILQHTDAEGFVYEVSVVRPVSGPVVHRVAAGDVVTYINAGGTASDALVVLVTSDGPKGQVLNVKVGKQLFENVSKHSDVNLKNSWQIKPLVFETNDNHSE